MIRSLLASTLSMLFCQAHAADSDNRNFTVDLGEGLSIAMVWCPPGTFTMGSPVSEMPAGKGEDQHQVTLTKGFWLASTEMTQAQWLAITGEVRGGKFKGPNLPTGSVTYDECVALCVKLTEKARAKNPACPAFRLPTEAEWEYACRAGTTTAYSFGDKLLPSQASFNWSKAEGAESKPAPGKPSPVGSFPPNAWGLYDMHGNDYEFCADWYADLDSTPATDPTGPASGTKRIIRGGAFPLPPQIARSGRRNAVPPEIRDPDRGMRVAAGP